MPSLPELLRLARRIHDACEQRATRSRCQQAGEWSRLENAHNQATRLRHSVEKAISHGWHLAASCLQHQLQGVVRSLADAAAQLQEARLVARQPLPRFGEVFTELQSLEHEFDEVTLIEKHVLAVQSETIKLCGVHLGRFSIRLHWPGLAHQADVDCFDIVALDPNPARDNEDVTHPHVRSRKLCAGDATVPVKMALEQGRLTDAFQLICSVLRNYNSSSAYTSLDEWEGTTCSNCGYGMSEENRSFCEGCDQDVCDECTSVCKHCDRTRCLSCRTRCDVCEETCCSGCLKTSEESALSCCEDCLRTCAACGAEVASSELDDDTERCPSCCENTEPETGPLPKPDKSNPSPPIGDY